MFMQFSAQRPRAPEQAHHEDRGLACAACFSHRGAVFEARVDGIDGIEHHEGDSTEDASLPVGIIPCNRHRQCIGCCKIVDVLDAAAKRGICDELLNSTINSTLGA